MTEYLVISRSNGTTKTGSPFCTLKLKNLEEELQIAVWDVKPTDEPIVGQTVSFFAMQDNGDKKSARKLDMHPGMVPQEGHPLYHLVPRPIKRALWDECINHLLSLCKDETLKPLITEFADVLFKPYSLYPAATSVHHAFKGGLLNHTYQMLHMLEGIYPVLPYDNVKLERCILAILTTAKCMNIIRRENHSRTCTFLGTFSSLPTDSRQNSSSTTFQQKKPLASFMLSFPIMVNSNMARLSFLPRLRLSSSTISTTSLPSSMSSKPQATWKKPSHSAHTS